MVTAAEFYPTARLTKPHWTTYAFGWFQEDYSGKRVDFHTGSIDGMVAIHGLIRDEKLGVYVLANLDHAELRHALMYTVFDRYAGRKDRDWSAEILKLSTDQEKETETRRKKAESQRVTGTSPSLKLEKYAGKYSDPLHGDVEITIVGERLHIKYGTRFDGTLEHWNYDTFRAKWDKEWLTPSLATFELDAQGRPSSLQF